VLALLSAQIGGDSSQGGIKRVASNGGQGCLHRFIGCDHFYLRSLALQAFYSLIQAFQYRKWRYIGLEHQYLVVFLSEHID
jgi:hypothetical protein